MAGFAELWGVVVRARKPVQVVGGAELGPQPLEWSGEPPMRGRIILKWTRVNV